MSKQLVIIHGGDFFDTRAEYVADMAANKPDKDRFLFDNSKGWKDTLASDLSAKGWEVFMPTMPNKYDAKYAEWKLWFENMLPFLQDGVALVGHSLGGIFLARYLNENQIGLRVSALFLVAAPYFVKGTKTANKAGFMVGDLSRLGAQAEKIFVIHSKDDPIVPFAHAERYCHALPHSVFMPFEGRHHFIGGKFTEIAKLLAKVG
jgi:predicted alpha/beta hydrolase family esterase